jgi:hypothetical protein
MSSTLASANPHLRDPALRRRGVLKSVASSSAIEGIRAPFLKAVAARKAAAGKTVVRVASKKVGAKRKASSPKAVTRAKA